MKKRKWPYLINTFYVNTVDSIKKALSLSQDHWAKLLANQGDADILAIKNYFQPFLDSFLAAYNQLQSRLGIYKGKTQTFEETLEELEKVKINLWRGKVFVVFPEGTADATAIFPQGRKPFQKGTYEQQVAAVQTLAETLATYTSQPSLIALSSEVAAYYIIISGARALQQTDEGSTETLRSNLKQAHVNLCNALYANLGSLMFKYAATPLVIENYFDLTLLRENEKDKVLSSVEGTIAAGAFANLGLLPTGAKRIRITIINGGPLEIGLSTDGTAFNGNTATISGIGSETIEIEDLNSIGSIILLRNQSATVLGSYKVEILG
jgi:hypothetical protein